jgi:hypothetical protein
MWDGRQYQDPEYPPPYAPYGAPASMDALMPEMGRPVSPRDVARQHDQRRRARLVRIVTLGVLVPVVLLIPSAIFPTFDIVSFVSLAIALVGTLATYVLNRLRQIGPAGYVLLLGISAGIAWDIFGKAHSQGGVDLGDLRLYDLFAIPVLLSGVLLSRRGPVIIAAVTTTFTTASLILLPRTPPLQQYWDGNYKYVIGSLYDVIAIAVLIQALTAVVAWLGADSIRRALLDASRAEELEAANQRNAAQAQELAWHQQRLQAGIQELQQVHSAVARGHWDARARVQEGELLPVAMSLNLLLDRLTRLYREQDQRTRIEVAAQQLAQAMRRMRGGQPYIAPAYSGTVLDEVLVELSTLRPTFSAGGPASRVGQDQLSSAGPASLPVSPDLDLAGGQSDTSGQSDGHQWPSLNGHDPDQNGLDYLPDWLRPYGS